MLAFLAAADRRVGGLIRIKRGLIRLLNERKQMIVHHAVTCGLDPDVPLKPSGALWLGDVPNHWDVKRLKMVARDINEQMTSREEGQIYVALENVESWTGRVLPADEDVMFDSAVKKFASCDVLFGKLRPYLAKVTRPNQDGVCVGEFLVLRADDREISPDFLEYLLRSKLVIDTVNSFTAGAKMPRADWGIVGALRIPIPPLEEQAQIVDRIRCDVAVIDTAAERARREVELLREYRTRLIADVVTGKLDVRGVPLPDYGASEVPDDPGLFADDADDLTEDGDEGAEDADE